MRINSLVPLGLLALVISLASPAAAQTYTTFSPGNGQNPQAGVTIKGDFIYGTTALGGFGNGVVYELKHLGNLFSFDKSSGPGPEARVVFGPDGHLYGTYNGFGGYVFVLTPQATFCKTVKCQPWKAAVLHTFEFPDGVQPLHGDLVWDQQGNIYGTTMFGGNGDLGAVYQMTPPVPPSQTWTEKVIWNFGGPDGEFPQSGVIFDGNGNLLGTALQGGAFGLGDVFQLTRSGDTWVKSNLYSFHNGTDGYFPIAGLAMDSSGNLYGATSDGGSAGGGTAFELVKSGSTYTYKLLFSFSGQSLHGCGPRGTLTLDPAGNLYGTTYCGGVNNLGSIFKLTNTQNAWVYTSLHDFPAFSGDIQNPISNVSIDAQGNLWGTASEGGPNNGGGVWRITP
jgi:uncharacterized repeat protein (TIGR03803 family)